MLREIAVNLHQAELPSNPKKHSLVVPLQECSSRLVTSVRPAPIVTSNKVEVPARTVLVNSTHTTEELEHQRSMKQLRMELESAHQAGKLAQQEIDQLRAKTECVVCLDKERDAVLFPCMQASCCHM